MANLFLRTTGSQPGRVQLTSFEGQLHQSQIVSLCQHSLVLTFMSDEKAEQPVPYEANLVGPCDVITGAHHFASPFHTVPSESFSVDRWFKSDYAGKYLDIQFSIMDC